MRICLVTIGEAYAGLPIFLYTAEKSDHTNSVINMKEHTVNQDKTAGAVSPKLHLGLNITVSSSSCFFSMLSAGFSVTAQAGCSINDFLGQDYGITEAYIDDRIQTIFLDGKAVDDSRTAMLTEGATLALSAAMPGMVGSTLRKGGVFAGMRSQISHVTDTAAGRDRHIRIKLKLFNLIAKELGPAFLQKGVYLEGNTFHEFLQRNTEGLKAACLAISLNDAKTDVAGLLEINWYNTEIFLQVTPEQKS